MHKSYPKTAVGFDGIPPKLLKITYNCIRSSKMGRNMFPYQMFFVDCPDG